MRTILIVVLVLILVSLASASNNTSITQIFKGNGTGVVPPTFDGDAADIPAANLGAGESAESAAGSADSFGSALLTAAAAPEERVFVANLLLEVKDANSGQRIPNAHIRVTMDDGTSKTDTLRFVGEDGKMQLQVSPGDWKITLKLDITSTVGKDHYYSFESFIDGDKNMTAYMQPVGSLRGDVFDSANTLIPGAIVKFECRGEYGQAESVTTDDFGSFTADWLPIGSCKVSAMSGNKAGSMTTQIAQGQLSEVRITLEQSVAATQDNYLWVFAIIMIGAIAAAIFLLKRRSGAKRIVPDGNKLSSITPDSHMESILSALDENEKKIVESLMRTGGKSMQNKIARELGLPKSSLSRAISGLEARDLVKTERLGRVRLVELSSWFLNGKKVS